MIGHYFNFHCLKFVYCITNTYIKKVLHVIRRGVNMIKYLYSNYNTVATYSYSYLLKATVTGFTKTRHNGARIEIQFIA